MHGKIIDEVYDIYKVCLSPVLWVLGGVMSFLTYVAGGWDNAVMTLGGFIIADYTSGLLGGFINKELSSEVGFKGIIKKVMLLFVVFVAARFDILVEAGGIIRNAAVYFLIANESISILENVGKCGVPVPRWLLNKLKQLQMKNDGEDLSDKEDDEVDNTPVKRNIDGSKKGV
jgi:toxin secretion/phage lysis holin